MGGPLKLVNTFSREELVAAFRMVVSDERAEEEANILSAPLDEADENGVPWFPADYVGDPRHYSPALLDLLSLVSEEAAAKAWKLLNISATEGEARRERFRQNLVDRK